MSRKGTARRAPRARASRPRPVPAGWWLCRRSALRTLWPLSPAGHALSYVELVDVLRLNSPGVVEEVNSNVLRHLQAEEQREGRLDAKAQGLLGSAALSLTVASTLGSMLLPKASSAGFGEVLGWALLLVVPVFVLALVLGLAASIEGTASADGNSWPGGSKTRQLRSSARFAAHEDERPPHLDMAMSSRAENDVVPRGAVRTMDSRTVRLLDERVPNGDWYRAGKWRDTHLYREHPKRVERSMAALSQLATPKWFREEAEKFCTIEDGDRVSNHPIIHAMLSLDYISFWPIYCLGDDLAALGNELPGRNPRRRRERPVRERLLDDTEQRGAAGELSAAALLRRAGVHFTWFPDEGGEFLIRDDSVEFLEVKRPLFGSDRVTDDMHRLFRLRDNIQATVPGYSIEFSLQHDLADSLTERKRKSLWVRIAGEFTSAARQAVHDGSLPVCVELPVGTLWVARNAEELAAMGAGCMGLAFDENHEAQRVIRGPIKAALNQLPPGRCAMIHLEWSGMRPEFGTALERRLDGLDDRAPKIAGVVVRGATLHPGEIVPRAWTQLIENKRMPGLARSSAVYRALAVDHHADLRVRTR
jgi:hypothetical protein